MGVNNNHEHGPTHCFSCRVVFFDNSRIPPTPPANVVCSTDPGLLISLAANGAQVNPRNRGEIIECHCASNPILPAEPVLSPQKKVEQSSVFNVVRILEKIPLLGSITATKSWSVADLDGTDLIVEIIDLELAALLHTSRIEIQVKSSIKGEEKFVRQSFDHKEKYQFGDNPLVVKRRLVINGDVEAKTAYIVANFLIQLEILISVLNQQNSTNSINSYHQLLRKPRYKIESLDDNLNSLLVVLETNRELLEQNHKHLLWFLRTGSCSLPALDDGYWQNLNNTTNGGRRPSNGMGRNGRRPERSVTGISPGGNGRNGRQRRR